MEKVWLNRRPKANAAQFSAAWPSSGRAISAPPPVAALRPRKELPPCRCKSSPGNTTVHRPDTDGERLPAHRARHRRGKIWELQQSKAQTIADVLGEEGFARSLTTTDLEYLFAED